MIEMLTNIVLGIVAGASSALVGYFRKTPLPEFSGPKFFKTIIIGAIAGGAYSYNPFYTSDVVVLFLEDFAYVTVIDRVIDLIWARIKGAYKKVTGQ